MLNRRDFLKALGLSVAALGCDEIGYTTDKPAKPNIILLLADDTGYGELGCYGQKEIKTPVLDQMAAEGIRFTDFYAGNTVCAPSRCCLATGKDPGHATLRGNGSIGENDTWSRVPLKKDEITIGEVLRQAGYHTGLIGKWHLEDSNDLSTWAHNRGFDFVIQRQWGKGHDWNKEIWINGEKKLESEVWEKKYVCYDEYRTEEACKFVTKHKDKPFFLFMSYKIPHTPESDLQDDEIYKDKGWPEVERCHAGRSTYLDRLIGVLFDKVKELGLDENTVFIYTSDNGPHNEGGHNYKFFKSSGPCRGFKRDLYEGGIRVPMIVRWKGTIKPGQVTNYISAFWDIMPTFAELAGIEPPRGINGISFVPTLLGKEQKKHDFLYWEFQLDGWWQQLPDGGFRQAVRLGDWKGLRYSVNEPTQLYDLKKDISETNDVSKQHPEVVAKINELFKTARTQTEGFPFGGKVQNYKAMDRWQQPKR